jgi:hypothetical protein
MRGVVLLNAGSLAKAYPGRWWVPPAEMLAALQPGRTHVKVLAVEPEGERDVWAACAIWLSVDSRDAETVTGTIGDMERELDGYADGDRMTVPFDRIVDLVLLDSDGDVLFNEARARFALGKRVLVGVTVLSSDEQEVVQRHAFAGVVASIEPARGIELRLDDQTSYWLPPDSSALQEAPPGEYQLHDTGQTIVDPDYITTWTITQSGLEGQALSLEGFAPPAEAYDDLRRELTGRRDVEPGSPASAEAIAAAVRVLGPLPEDYRSFLAEFGWLACGEWEVFGLGAGIPPHLDVVAVTRSERAEGGLPDRLVAVLNDGSGNLTCIDTTAPAGASMVLWNHETSPEEGAFALAATFSGWLVHTVRFTG